QVLVYVDAHVPAGTTLEESANRAFKAWGVGQKGKDNGVLFVVFLDDRVMRLEVGYGLEGALPDARAKQITSEVVKPRFKTGDFTGGIESGAQAVVAAARGEPYQGTGRTVAETVTVTVSPAVILWPGLGLAAVVAVVVGWLRRRKGEKEWPLVAIQYGAAVFGAALFPMAVIQNDA